MSVGPSPIRLSDLLIFFFLFALVAIVFSFQSSFDFRGRASGTPAHIIVDTSQVGEDIDTSFYHSFAQGGSEKADMIDPIISLVKPLHPVLIRIDHIYDGYDVVSKNSEGLRFNWDRLDAVVDSIVKTGAIPLLSLSYMPPAIAKDGAVINVPINWNDWQQTVAETIRQYSGKKQIKNMRYEVWNEPDLGQFGSWKYYGSKNYLQLYQYASRAAKQVSGVQPFYLGGPATTSYYEAWMQNLLASGNRVDFISWHVYDPDPKTIATHMGKFSTLLQSNPQFGTIPVYITEFGHSGDKSPLYSSNYEAVHTAATVRQLADVPLKPLLFTFQLKDAESDAGNGWGIITHEQKGAMPKPRYSVYSFLDTMKGKRLIVSGEGSWVTGLGTIQGRTIRLLLMNMDPKNPGASHVETVPVSFTKLAPGNYILKRKRFLEKEIIKKFHIDVDSAEFSIFMPSSSMEILELSPESL